MMSTRLAAAAISGWLALGDDDLSALELAWTAPPTCPDAGEVRRRTATYLDADASLRPVSAAATVRRDAAAWALELTFDDTTRHFTAQSCDDLGNAAAVVLSLALSPGHEHDTKQLEQVEPLEPAEPTEEAEPAVSVRDDRPRESPAIVEPPRESPRPTPPRVQAVVHADAGLGYGITPTLTTATLRTAIAWPHARLGVSGTLWAPALAASGERPPWVTMGTVDLRGCGVPTSGSRLHFPLCGGVAMGAVRVDDRGAASRGAHHRLWVGAIVSAAVVWRFRPYAGLFFGPELSIALRRPEVQLAGGGAYRTGPIAVRGALGIELYFPSRVVPRAGKSTR